MPSVPRERRNADEQHDGDNDDPDRQHEVRDSRERERGDDPGHAVTKSETAPHVRDIGRSTLDP